MLLFSIILGIGAITTFTDLKSKKIYNRHLAIGAILGLISIVYVTVVRQGNVIPQIISGLIAFVVGAFLHRISLWRGGDAKLFTLYAFLMPPMSFSPLPLPSAVSLFACSFIAGMTILFPIFIKDIIVNHDILINKLILKTNRQALFYGIAKILFYPWVLFPFYYLLRTIEIPFILYSLERIANPVIILTVLFLIFSSGYLEKKDTGEPFLIKFLKKNYIELILGILFGYFMRLWLAPDSLSFSTLSRYFSIIILSGVISTCVHITLKHFENYQERFPFAPLLFMGCLLSYTPVLNWIMTKASQWNVLLYR